MLAFIVGLKAEAKLLKAHFQIAGSNPAAACERALAEGASALVSFGLAGGLSPALAAGDIVVPGAVLVRGGRLPTDVALSRALGGVTAEIMLASDNVVGSVAGKAALRAGTGADAVDMESGAVAEAARRAGVPFGVLRAVCDPAGRALPPAALAALDTGGRIVLAKVATSVMRYPGQVGALLTLSRDAARARQALAARMADIGARGGLAPWG